MRHPEGVIPRRICVSGGVFAKEAKKFQQHWRGVTGVVPYGVARKVFERSEKTVEANFVVGILVRLTL